MHRVLMVICVLPNPFTSAHFVLSVSLRFCPVFLPTTLQLTALACHIRSSLEGDAFSREVLQCARKAGFTFDPGVGYR